jgi:hypothetical protein
VDYYVFYLGLDTVSLLITGLLKDDTVCSQSPLARYEGRTRQPLLIWLGDWARGRGSLRRSRSSCAGWQAPLTKPGFLI